MCVCVCVCVESLHEDLRELRERGSEMFPIEQAVIVHGKVEVGDLGFLSLRMVEAKQGGKMTDIVNVAFARMLEEHVGPLIRKAMMLSDRAKQATLARLARRLDTSDVRARTDGADGICTSLFPILSLLHAHGVATQGPGILVVEVGGTLQQAVRGFGQQGG